MASFSVDITEVILAGAHSGYKDITIIGMPQAGVNCTITGTDTSSFGFRIPGDDQNVYRVYSTATGTTSVKNAVFKITNLADASDYVEVQLHQLKSQYVDLDGNIRGCVVDVICDDTNTMINAARIPGDGYTNVYFNQNNGGYSTAHCTVLLDGYWTIPTGSGKPVWITLTSDLGYTDTGFKIVYISCINNYSGPREYRLNFNNADHYRDYVKVMQDGYPGSTSGCTEILNVPKNGGTFTTTLNHPSISSSYFPEIAGDEFYYIYGSGSGYNTERLSKTTNKSTFSITLPANTTGEEIRTFVEYYDRAVNDTPIYLGHTTIIQAGDGPVSTLTVDPNVLDYPASGGGRTLDVTYATSLSTNESSFPDWLGATYVSTAQGSGQYTITAATNTSTSSRNFDFELADVNMSLVVPITQAGGDPASLSISPTSNSVSSSSGSVQITVTSSGISEVQYSISDSWITYGGKSGDVYTFNYAAKSTTGQRTGTITFYGGGLSETYTLVQAGASQLIVSPTSNSVSSSSGSVSVTVTGSDNISYSISGNWLSYSSKSGNVYTFNYTANSSSSSRTSTVTFSAPDMVSGTFTLTQQAATEVLTATPSSLNYTSSGGEKSIVFTYTGILHMRDDTPDWITDVQYSIGSSPTTYYITAGQNTSEYAREWYAYFYDDNSSLVVPIIQNGTTSPSLSVSPTSGSVAGNSGRTGITLTVRGIRSSDISCKISGSWLSFESNTDYTFYFSYPENTTGSSRTAMITFSGAGKTARYTLTQQTPGVPVSLSISPTSKTVSGAPGRVDITVNQTGIENLQYTFSSGSGFVFSHIEGNVYVFSYETNTSTLQSRTATITFSGAGLSETFTLNQQPQSTVKSLNLIPTSDTVDGGSGYVYVTVSANRMSYSNISRSIDESWLSYVSTAGWIDKYLYRENTTGSSRTATVTYTGESGLVKTYTLTQNAGSGPSPVITVSPTSESVSSAFGVIDVTATGADDITHSISQGSDWITYRGKTGDVFSFDYTSNTSTSSRTGIITFSASGATSGTYTLIQAGENPGPGPGPGPGPSPEDPRTLKTYPNKLRYYSEGGDKRVSFINRPENGIGYEITYTDGSGWLSVSNSGSEKVVTATANSGIRRKASIKFYDLDDSDNYVIVPVIQGSINFYASVWMDDLYYPDDRDEDGNYYYRITDQDTEKNYFIGVSTVPPGWQGNVGGIDVPRLVENYLDTNFSNSSDWEDMSTGYCTVDVYNMTEGDPGVVDATFKYWNDWSRFERRYDYTRYLNDPINGRGSDMMLIPVCVYYDDAATFSIVETDKYGNTNTNTYQTPAAPFVMCSKTFTDVKTADFMQDNDVIFSYEMNHCGPGAFIYRNRFGGWDSFLIEGNISKTDNYTKQNWRRNGEYNQGYSVDYLKYFDENVTDSININTTYEAYTGWLTDEESERLVFHLLSSPKVYFQNLHKENQLFDTDSELNLLPVRITASSAEYKKFRNGKRLVNYLITFEKCNIEKVRN